MKKTMLSLLCLLVALLLSAMIGACQPAPAGEADAQAAPVAHAANAESLGWGELVTDTTPYAIYRQSFSYAAPFLVTDLREDEGYAIHSNKESYDQHQLSLYRAHDGQSFLTGQPVVFFIHGGAWTDGYRDWYDGVSHSFTGSQGWTLVVIDYRLASDEVFLADAYCPDRRTCNLPANRVRRTKAAGYPDNFEDVAAAFRWTVENIGVTGGDPQKIVVFGHSAGAHLAALLATHPDTAELRPSIQGLALVSGLYKLDAPGGMLLYAPVLEQVFGFPYTSAMLAEASPLSYLSAGLDLPPLLIASAEDELPRLPEQTAALTSALQAQQIPFQLEYFAGYSHFGEMAAIRDTKSLPAQTLIAFIDETAGCRCNPDLPVVDANASEQ